MLDLKKLPSHASDSRGYIGWSPGGDYLWTTGGGWNSNLDYTSWPAFLADYCSGDTSTLDDDYNLVADFYFEARSCSECDGGYSEAYVAEAAKFRAGGWDSLTDDDYNAWRESERGKNLAGLYPSRGELVAGFKEGGRNLDLLCVTHEFTIITARLEARGEPTECAYCGGEGSTAKDGIKLNIWMLHPRKGASRGITIDNIQEDHLPEIKAWLRRSLEQHKRHFAWALE